jgi:hypothetical protein
LGSVDKLVVETPVWVMATERALSVGKLVVEEVLLVVKLVEEQVLSVEELLMMVRLADIRWESPSSSTP